MNTKHTAGPWTVFIGIDRRLQVFGNGIRKMIATINTPNADNWHKDFEQWEANAKLIAAAPDLLEALQKIASESDYEDNMDEDSLKCCMHFIKSLAGKAIAKATE